MQAQKETVNKSILFLRGGGEMGKLIRNYNWNNTSLGEPVSWPQSLRTTLSIILNSTFPMLLFWGPEHFCFYNDACHTGMGVNGKYLYAPGKKGIEVWPETWKDIQPVIADVLAGGERSSSENQLLPIYYNGKTENVYKTFHYSALYDESENPAGVLVTCTETANEIITRKELEINKHDFNLALEIAELGTYKLTLATNTVKISERIMNWFGFKDENISLNRLKSIVHPNDLYRTAKLLNDTTKSEAGSRHDIQYTVLDPRNGQERHIRSMGKAVFESGVAVSIEGILQDITEQANIQKKIERSEQRFRNLIRYATVGVAVLTGPEMIVNIANEFYCQVIGKTYRGLIGKPLFDVVPEMDGYFRKQIERVRVTGIPRYLYEQPFFVLNDGNRKQGYTNLVYQPLREKNEEISGVVVLLHDITELVMARHNAEYAEQRARLAIDTAGLGVYEVNLVTDEIIPDANFIKIYGFDHAAKRSEYAATVHPEDRHIRNDAHDLSVITGHLEYECRLRWKNNSIHWIHVQGKVFYDEAHLPVKLLGVVQDITEQKLVSEELERKVAKRTHALAEANSQLHKTNTELNQFAYIASHDLQEPLRKITTYTGMLRSSLKEINDDGRNYIDKIINSSNRMKALISDVLAFSQISESSHVFQITDLNIVLQDIKDEYELIIAQKNATISNNNLPTIEASALQMTQLFANLMSNALKFTRKNDTPYISIEASTALPEEIALIPELDPQLEYCRIVFKDNGIGFSAEYAEKIFAIFQRLHNKEHFDGTGIGLAICRKIALNHNGYISASSEQNEGATFNIMLPLNQLK